VALLTRFAPGNYILWDEHGDVVWMTSSAEKLACHCLPPQVLDGLGRRTRGMVRQHLADDPCVETSRIVAVRANNDVRLCATLFVIEMLSSKPMVGGIIEPSPNEPVFEALTAAERRVMEFLASGRKNREIAEKLHISVNTVRTHVQRILAKLGVTNRLQAVLLAQRWGP
jgi:DNA-binding NarL/FixJ family response regulator